MICRVMQSPLLCNFLLGGASIKDVHDFWPKIDSHLPLCPWFFFFVLYEKNLSSLLADPPPPAQHVLNGSLLAKLLVYLCFFALAYHIPLNVSLNI